MKTRGMEPQEKWPEALDAIEELIHYYDEKLLDKEQLRDRLELILRAKNQTDLSFACILPVVAPTEEPLANRAV